MVYGICNVIYILQIFMRNCAYNLHIKNVHIRFTEV